MNSFGASFDKEYHYYVVMQLMPTLKIR